MNSVFIFDVNAETFQSKLDQAAIDRTYKQVRYDGRYLKMPYPNGDVPKDIGVCTDVIIRAYRKVNIDLQQLVHQDIKANFSDYPSNRIWGLNRPDTNIDHRRVPNLRKFFSRNGRTLKITTSGIDYQPGDLVTWMLPGNLPHIGLVTSKQSKDGKRPLIAHNIGSGPRLEDMLFKYKITGHYQYGP